MKKRPQYGESHEVLNIFEQFWWASRESNTAPTDYESAALTKHELEAQFPAMHRDHYRPALYTSSMTLHQSNEVRG